MRAFSTLDPADLFEAAIAMELALVGLRSRLNGMERRRASGLPFASWETEDALADIDRALAPSASRTPEPRQPALILLEAAE